MKIFLYKKKTTFTEQIIVEHKHLNSLRANINLTNFRMDSLEQYDPEKIVFDICKEIENKAPPGAIGKSFFQSKIQ